MIIKRRVGDRGQTHPVALTDDGEIVVDVADTSDFPVNAVKTGYQTTGIYEIYLRGPEGDGMTFQGALVVARRA